MPDALWEGVREGCGTCAFGDCREMKVNANTVVSVSCRRFPPVLMYIDRQNPGGMPYKDVEQWRPTMAESDWCGEYQRNLT